jgi:hypothetical protein
MSYYTLYDPSTGQIVATTTSNLDPGEYYIEGKVDGAKYYIDNGQAVLIPREPIKYLQKYAFNWQTKQWDIDLDQTSNLVRMARDKTLNQTVDTFNPIRYASLTTEQQQELATYRQALLDITKQTTWPTDVVWPTKPTWL